MSRLSLLILLCGLIALTGCAPAPTATPELTVFAAASLTDAFTELAAAFEAQDNGVAVALNFAGSSQLAAQLREGVAADVFASANADQMEAAIAAGRVDANAPVQFVSNRLTVIVPASNPANIETLDDLARPGVTVLLAAEGVPVRQYTDEVVGRLAPDRQAALYGNVVSAESNVRQVAAKIALGEADAGVVYASDITPDIAPQVAQIPIPDTQNVIATYPIAVLDDAGQPEAARRFVDFVLSPDGQAILGRWGFGRPPGAEAQP